LKTIALVQGDALGGGFECALSGNVLIAERGAKMGFPEILFNLFPGMGAMTCWGVGSATSKAEKIILSGKLFSPKNCTSWAWWMCWPSRAKAKGGL
jgi:DSF synthase